MLETTISNFIEQQFPAIYREEGPYFVEFLKQYYVWLETDPTSPIYQARRYVSNHDIDSTVDNFVVFFKEKYLKSIQLNTATNTKQLIKNSIDLYRSKGTENAIRLFFDLIFSAPSEVYYPGNDIFKLSGAEWHIPKYLEVTSNPVNRLMVGRSITGVESGATAFVEKLVRRKIKNTYIEVFYISAITGEFETGEIISLTSRGSTALSEFPRMIGSLTTVEVTQGGEGFTKGEVVKLESRTGAQGRAIVDSIESIGGIVNFTLLDGGWGYTVNTDMRVSEKVLELSNVSITSVGNTSLEGKIVHIVQPMANVQWYDNTAFFAVGDVVYNYYANGSLIGANKIISAEYGTSNTTNFFLLNNISGNNHIDITAPTYYTAGNVDSFTVQNAGWVNMTASGTFNGLSSNVFIYCTGNSDFFSVGDTAYQLSTNNQIYASANVGSITSTGSNSFVMKVTGLHGLYLTNQKLLSSVSSGNVDITSLSYDIGITDVDGTFVTYPGNRIFDTANNSLFTAAVLNIPFGSGANVSFDDDMVNTESVSLNTNFLSFHANNALNRNHLNAASFGATLNDANVSSPVLGLALQFTTLTLGTIARLERENPGSEYSYAPFVDAIDPLMAPLHKMDFVIRINTATGIFAIGELVTQAANGARGLVKSANTSEVHVRRLTYADKWAVGNTTPYLMKGEKSGHSAYVQEVTYDTEGVAGHNAVISANVTSSNSAVSSLKVVDSGFSFADSDNIEFTSLDNLRSGTAIGSVLNQGIGAGYYRSTSGFLSTNKYLYDGDYYQDFSYEIRSPITIGRYSDMLKSVLHVSGTKAFSAILKTAAVDSSSSVKSSTVSQANT